MSSLIVSNVSDGTLSIPTTYVTNGSAKAWVNFNGTGTIAARDSFNVSSLTDNGTGDYTVNFSNGMSNGNYSATGHISNLTDAAAYNPIGIPADNRASSNFKVDIENNSSVQTDGPSIDAIIIGDLA